MNSRHSLAVISLATLLLAGCHVETHKDGNKDNVDIGTPFGSMHVNTNPTADSSAIGITQYPGSVPYQGEGGDHDKDSADVNMNFGSFHLTVKAATYQTADSQDKIIAFYRNDLKRYGDVIECQNKTSIGKPDRTSQGLTCDEHDNARHGNIDVGSGIELRAGSPQRQHVVGIEKKNGSYKVALISLVLPSDSHNDNPE